MMTWCTCFIIAAGLACITFCILGWAHGKRFGFRRGWWPFLGAACCLLLGRELLPGAPTARAASVEETIRLTSEVAGENLRLAEELNKALKCVKLN